MTDAAHPLRAVARVRAVLFDFDRTLVSFLTPQAEARMAEAVLCWYERALDHPADHAARALVAAERNAATPRPISLWASVHHALSVHDPARARRITDEVAFILTEHECAAAGAEPGPVAMPGVESTLRWLEAEGVELAVVSANSQAAVRTALHRAGILTRFDVVVARTPELDMAALEPSPFAVGEALQRLDCPASEAVYVGDDVLGMRAARAAGVWPVGVRSGVASNAELTEAGADVVLASVTGLRGLLRQAVAVAS